MTQNLFVLKSLKYFIENFVFWLLLNHSHHIKQWLASIQKLLDIVCTVVNSMVSHSVLWKVVGSNLLGTRGSSNLNFTESLTLLQLFVKLYLVKAARQKVNTCSESTFEWDVKTFMWRLKSTICIRMCKMLLGNSRDMYDINFLPFLDGFHAVNFIWVLGFFYLTLSSNTCKTN